jgi:predicted enzyme related to lactoylglutathione lyase
VGYEREHTPGTPSWIDLTSPDLVISARFYGGLLGWDTALRGPADLTGGYLTFRVEGLDVAGLGRLADYDDPPAWTTYFAVRDIEATEAAVAGNGGTTLVAPVEVPDAGHSALFTDPTGAVFGVWQPAGHRGADLVGSPGSMCWNQLASRNIEASKRFYGAVFGWEGTTTPYETSTYTSFRLDGREIVGMIEMDRSWPRGLPSHWLTYFRVDDCDAVAAEAVELGGEVSVEPYDVPQLGRAAVLADPHGAVFSVLTPNERIVGLSRRRAGDLGADVDGLDELEDEGRAIEIPDDPLDIDVEVEVDDDVAVAGKRKSA